VSDAGGPGAREPEPTGRGLASPPFRALLFGQVVSILGDRLNYLALVGLLSAHAAAHGESLVPWLSALAWAMLAPSLFVSPWAGALVDRLPLVRLLLWTDAARALVVAAIPLAFALTRSPEAVLALVTLAFTLNCFFLPARSALPPHLVPEGAWTAANALLILSGVVATVIGSALGGWLTDRIGPRPALALDALTYVVSVLAFVAILRAGVEVRPERRAGGERDAAAASGVARLVRRAARDVAAGWSRIVVSPGARTPVVAGVATWLAGGVLHVAGTPHVQQGGAGVTKVGALLAILALGAAAGTGITLALEKRRGGAVPGAAASVRTPGRARSLGAGLAGAGAGLAGFALATAFPAMAAAAFVVGLCAAPVYFLSDTAIQEAVPAGERARVFSARDALARAGFLATVALAAPLVTARGTRLPLALAGAVLVALGLALVASGAASRAAVARDANPVDAA
jgi:MFS family permease